MPTPQNGQTHSPTKCLSVFDHFVKLTLKGLREFTQIFQLQLNSLHIRREIREEKTEACPAKTYKQKACIKETPAQVFSGEYGEHF